MIGTITAILGKSESNGNKDTLHSSEHRKWRRTTGCSLFSVISRTLWEMRFRGGNTLHSP